MTEDTRYKTFVQAKLPSAHIQTLNGRYRVVRNTQDFDPDPTAMTVSMCAWRENPEDAWRDSAIRIGWLS